MHNPPYANTMTLYVSILATILIMVGHTISYISTVMLILVELNEEVLALVPVEKWFDFYRGERLN